MLFRIPNTVEQKDGFYISYNDSDVDIYGCDTTALVIGQMEKFYILNGDHRHKYSTLSTLDECISYYRANLGISNRRSDPLPSVEISNTETA